MVNLDQSAGTRWFDGKYYWEKVRRLAVVPELNMKDSRDMYAIELAEAGASMHDIQQALGHICVSTTERHYPRFLSGALIQEAA